MAVAAGVIGDAQYAALITFVNVTTQGSRATVDERGDAFSLLVGDGMALPIGLAILAKDVSDFVTRLRGAQLITVDNHAVACPSTFFAELIRGEAVSFNYYYLDSGS